MIGMIVAVSPEGVIGVEGKIPWRYPADMKRFKRLTVGGTVIMGRRTWESMGQKALADRRNIVISRGAIAGAERFLSLPEALATCQGPVWLIGGRAIYQEGMEHADRIDVTYVPDPIAAPGAVKFPPIDPALWNEGPLVQHEDDPRLQRRVYTRRRQVRRLLQNHG